jgi:DNA-directed RNA polymerase subunit L
MDVTVLEIKDNKVRLVLNREGHTFANAIVNELLNDPDVDVAKYTMEFQFSEPELLVTTKGQRKPLDAIREAADRIVKNCDDLLDSLEKA